MSKKSVRRIPRRGAKRSPKRKSSAVKRKKSLPFKAWMEALKDSTQGGQDVEDTKDTTPKRRGGL